MAEPSPATRRIGREAWLRHLRAQQSYEAALRRALRDAARDASAQVLRLPTEGASAAVRRAQYNVQRQALLEIQSDLWGRFSGLTNEALGRQSTLAAQGTDDLLAHLLSAGVPGPEANELIAGMRAAAHDSAERLAARIGTRVDLSPRVYRNQQLASGRIDTIVNNGIANGKSAREIARDVARFIRPDVRGGVSYAAMRLGRTELNRAFHESSKAIYQDHPWVEGVKWELSGSHPRNDICNDYAEGDNFNLGRGMWPKDQVPQRPHPNCLCFITPQTPGPKAFVNGLLSGDYNDWLTKEGLATF